MTTVKTAISLPGSIFEEVGHLARELHLPRSQVFVMAVKEFLEKAENRRLFQKLNQVYASPEETSDRKRLSMAKKRHRALVKHEW